MLSRRSLLGMAASSALAVTTMPEVGAAQRAVRAERRRSFLGLIEPPISGKRLLDQPGVMSSPPTITLGEYGQLPTIANYKVFEESDAAFRFFGSRVPVLQNSTFYAPGPLTVYWAIDFLVDAQAFEVQSQAAGGAAPFRLIVDGEYASLDVEDGQTGGGGFYWFKVTFPQKAIRHVVIEGDGTFKFGGFAFAKRDHVWRAETPVGPRVSWIGDSFVEGAGAIEGSVMGPYGLAIEASKALGWRDVQANGRGGTGYLKTLTGGDGFRPNFRARWRDEVLPAEPDIIVVWGGLNDANAFTKAAIGEEVALFFADVKAELPASILIVVGPYWSDAPSQSGIDCRDAVYAASVGYAHLFIDPIVATAAGQAGRGWLTGNGKVGAETGTGNADVYTSNDGTHPSRAGHAYLGSRVAQAITKWTRLGSPFGAVHAGNAITVPE